MTRQGFYAYFLDVDGTLFDFADVPGAVDARRDVCRVMDALARSAGGAVALVSGRSLADLDRLFPRRRFAAAGMHGLERRTAAGRVVRRPLPIRRLAPVRARLSGVVARHPRLLLEDKGGSLALHYRRAPRLAGFSHRVMRAVLGELGAGYRLQRGKRVIEIVPRGGGKGAAIGAFMREPPFRGRTPVFIGDDATDEGGFGVVNTMGGRAIKVGPGRTAARWRLRDVPAVLAWLARRPEPGPESVTGSIHDDLPRSRAHR